MFRQNEEFNWSSYDSSFKGGNRLVANTKIKGTTDHIKCFSREVYSQQLFDLINNDNFTIVKKDLERGDQVLVTAIKNVVDSRVTVQLLSGFTLEVNFNDEKKLLQVFGYSDVKEFCDLLKNPDFAAGFVSNKLYVSIIESKPNLKFSLWQGYLNTLKTEFVQQISNPTKAYKAKIIDANRGGFFCEVQGIQAFMPGSLAAPNKIYDFNAMIGKEVIVMVEDYLNDMASFIVSHKKYLDYIIPIKIKELDLTKQHSGYVTGTSAYGIFVEFDEIFTGLLHTSKMHPETLEKFNAKEFKSGESIDFYISEISKYNRIILSEESYAEKMIRIYKWVLDNKDAEIDLKIVDYTKSGFIVEVDDIKGILPVKEFRKNKINENLFKLGDRLKAKINNFEDEKITFKF